MSQVCPNTIIVEEDALQKLGDLLQGYEEVICISDETIIGHYSTQLKDILEREPRWILAEDARSGWNEPLSKESVILGFGGGRSLDAAKILAAQADLDWISIPTAASHDGIASEVASVSQDGYRYSKKCRLPIAIVADLTIMAKAPEQLRRAGMGDILCKASSLSEWKLAHEKTGERIDRDAFDLVQRALENVLKKDDLKTLVHAEIDAGTAMCMHGSSRPCSGSEHAISHAMDIDQRSLHGLQVIFATPLCLHFLERRGYAIYEQEYISNIMVRRGLPSKCEDMSISRDDYLDYIGHAIKIMKERGRYSVLENVETRALSKVIDQLYECE